MVFVLLPVFRAIECACAFVYSFISQCCYLPTPNAALKFLVDLSNHLQEIPQKYF